MFILVVSSSDTLLVFYFRHCPRLPFSAALSVLKGLIIVPVRTMDPFLLEDNPFKKIESSRAWRTRALPSEVHPGGKF